LFRIEDGRSSRLEPASDFFILPSQDVGKENVLQPGEMVTEILLPAPVEGIRSVYRKVRERGAWDFALASVAAAIELEGGVVRSARIVLGGVAPMPWVASEAENMLVGRVLDPDSARLAAEAAVSDAEPMEQNGFKVPLVKGIVKEALLSLA
jgi:xanthine dehydrogenase YagS FAD-binding subunit